jgi:hypothetical protein
MTTLGSHRRSGEAMLPKTNFDGTKLPVVGRVFMNHNRMYNFAVFAFFTLTGIVQILIIRPHSINQNASVQSVRGVQRPSPLT